MSRKWYISSYLPLTYKDFHAETIDYVCEPTTLVQSILRLSAYGSHIVSFFYLVLSTELHQFEEVLASEHLQSVLSSPVFAMG